MPKAKAKNIALILLSPCGGFSISEKTSQTPESSSSFHYHEFSDVWSYDAEHHWRETTCGRDVRSDEDVHDFEKTVVEPTYEAGGYTEYACPICGYSYREGESDPLSITVTWVNYDGTVLEVGEGVEYGSVPSYLGPVPTRPDSVVDTYSFCGWSPEVGPVYADATYTAQYLVTTVFEFTENEDRTGLISSPYFGEGADVVCPSEYRSLPLVRIGSEVFSLNEDLTSVVLPESLEFIGYAAFGQCGSLREVSIGADSRLETIGKRAFYGCSPLSAFPVPDGVVSIGDSDFNGCTAFRASRSVLLAFFKASVRTPSPAALSLPPSFSPTGFAMLAGRLSKGVRPLRFIAGPLPPGADGTATGIAMAGRSSGTPTKGSTVLKATSNTP